jgi:hypothetical protein
MTWSAGKVGLAPATTSELQRAHCQRLNSRASTFHGQGGRQALSARPYLHGLRGLAYPRVGGGARACLRVPGPRHTLRGTRRVIVKGTSGPRITRSVIYSPWTFGTTKNLKRLELSPTEYLSYGFDRWRATRAALYVSCRARAAAGMRGSRGRAVQVDSRV